MRAYFAPELYQVGFGTHPWKRVGGLPKGKEGDHLGSLLNDPSVVVYISSRDCRQGNVPKDLRHFRKVIRAGGWAPRCITSPEEIEAVRADMKSIVGGIATCK